ncbi:hypothetical protein IFT68_23070 [Oxalobacteraceae sp. CFBP 13730]|nr:hypothetical protein [Oxalobacteraceae sp. CFBP 13730]
MAQFHIGEISRMMQWARIHQQPANGSINLVNWPGWHGACERLHLDAGRAREVAAALLARLGASSAL